MLDVSNGIMVYFFPTKYQYEELPNGASDFIFANFAAVAEIEDFLNLSSKDKEIEEWISSDEIIIKREEEVFQVIVKWMENGNREDLRVPFDQNFRKFRFIIEWNRKFPETHFEKYWQPLEVVVLSGNVEIPEILYLYFVFVFCTRWH